MQVEGVGGVILPPYPTYVTHLNHFPHAMSTVPWSMSYWQYLPILRGKISIIERLETTTSSYVKTERQRDRETERQNKSVSFNFDNVLS